MVAAVNNRRNHDFMDGALKGNRLVYCGLIFQVLPRVSNALWSVRFIRFFPVIWIIWMTG